MAGKTVKIGSVWLNEVTSASGEAKKVPSIKLGSKGNKDPQYDLSVEIIVRDSKGTVVARQTDGFVNMYAPREGAPSKLKHDLVITRS